MARFYYAYASPLQRSCKERRSGNKMNKIKELQALIGSLSNQREMDNLSNEGLKYLEGLEMAHSIINPMTEQGDEPCCEMPKEDEE